MTGNGTGQVITFYSYKGGVGRTMALANIACLLAEKKSANRRILMVDWDLEAPGLHRFFRGLIKGGDPKSKPGLIELFQQFKKTVRKPEFEKEENADRLFEKIAPKDYILKTKIPGLDLLKAGRFDEDYAARVNTFNWEKLYARVPWLFRAFAEHLASRYSHVLIDSRTGVTDISGICTMLLPEKLVAVFSPNRQSLLGVLEQAREATNYRRQSNDLRPLMIYPLPSRIEETEPSLRDKWRFGDSKQELEGYQPLFEKLLKTAYDLAQCDLNSYFKNVKIQHVPAYAYGEEIAVLREKDKDRLSLPASYEVFLERLLNAAGVWEEIESELALTQFDLNHFPDKPEVELKWYERFFVAIERFLFVARGIITGTAPEPEVAGSPGKVYPRDYASNRYDVFISYNSNDFDVADILATRLLMNRISVWLDKYLNPRIPVEYEIERHIVNARIVLFLIGRGGLGLFQKTDLSLIKERIGRNLIVIPVLLPGATHEDVPFEFRSIIYFDFRKKDPDSLVELIRSIKKHLQNDQS